MQYQYKTEQRPAPIFVPHIFPPLIQLITSKNSFPDLHLYYFAFFSFYLCLSCTKASQKHYAYCKSVAKKKKKSKNISVMFLT